MTRASRKPSDGDAQGARVKNDTTPSGVQRLKDEHRFLLTGNGRR
jgi:hypothetical protein